VELGPLLRGVAVGFAIAAPVGPIGLLCIQRTLAGGRLVGLATGLGAATADAFYGFVAAFGLTLLTSFLVGQRVWLGLLGGAFLISLGVRTFRAPPAQQAAGLPPGTLLRSYLSTLGLTLANPATIIAFFGIFAGAGLAAAASTPAAGLMVVGVFLGSAAWWLLLSSVVGLLRGRFDARALVWVNRVAGVVIAAFGLAAIFMLVRG
jgi:threonine/homoserine/homoserine lactone efflux protein